MAQEIRASHILVKTENDARIILQRCQNGESFAKLAEEYSMDSSKRRGGDLGYFGRGRMVRNFENAAFALENGQVSQPIKTEFGWHLIKVTDKK